MKMKRRFVVILAAAFAAVALLVPAGSAQAAWRTDTWCADPTNLEYRTYVRPGKSCTSFPLNVNSFGTFWHVHTSGGGQVCLGLTQYGGSRHGYPVDGVPGLRCGPVGNYESYNSWYIYQYNPYLRYSYRYGQARIYNFSTATISVGRQYNWLTHWVP